MLRACKYCGRVHDSKFDCGKKHVHRKKNTELDKFRSSKAWQQKRDQIRERDKQLCQICIRELYGTIDRYTYGDLSVHHAVPLEIDYERRLDNDNLLTLCGRHHEMAEHGKIPLHVILKIIQEQEGAAGK